MAESMNIEAKIAHFLRLAENEGATQEERDLASSQAERLMLKHGIDRAMAEHADNNKVIKEEIVQRHVFFGGGYGEARMQAAYSIVVALKLQAFKSERYGIDPHSSHGKNGRMTKGVELYVVGFESDVMDALTLIFSLDLQGAVAVKQYAKSQKDAWSWYDNNRKTLARKSFLIAFGNGAGKRIREQRVTVIEESSDGTALVLVDRAAQVKEFYDQKKLRKSRSRGGAYDYSAHNAGYAAGQNANVGANALTGRARISA